MFLGNLDAQRDWGHARDYVEGMWRIMQQEKPDDYVLATGTTTRVRTFVEKAFAVLGVTITWQGKGVDETGSDQNGTVVVRVDPAYFRPTEVDLLLGDPKKAKEQLGWVPKTDLDALIKEMVEADYESAAHTTLKW